MKNDDIILTALSWEGTPYHHHAMIKGVGVDCAKLVAGVALECGLISQEAVNTIPNYPVQWHLHSREENLLAQLDAYHCVRKEKSNTLPGDIVTFRFGRVSSHLGIVINQDQFIHARYDFGKVVINNFNEEWYKRWTYTYAFPGVN